MWSKALALATLGAVCLATTAFAQPPLLSSSIVEHLGQPVPRSLTFTDDAGRQVTLGSLMDGRPLVIGLAYFTCPMLCHLGQDGAADAFRDSGWQLGRDFRAVTISIDPHDTPAVAHQWRERAAEHLHVSASAMDWPFLVGEEPTIRRLADAVGFRYAYDETTGQYSHAAALFIAGADGRLSHYLYGITFTPADVAAALSAAKGNRRLPSTETFLMRCFHYIPALQRHGGAIVWLLRTTGVLVTASIASALILLWRREGRA